MQHIIYAMHFKGQAAPVMGSANTLKVTTIAISCSINTVVGASGVAGTVKPLTGDDAVFESEVTLTGQNAFQEAGAIIFGEEGHKLRFTTVGQGHIDSCADPTLKHGSVIWRVEGGEGQFDGASGLITSNFTVSDTGEVTDNHFGVIFVK